MKAANYSWWIGAIFSTVLVFVFLDADSSLNGGMLLFIGVVNGIFWGWVVGAIIDKIISAPKNKNLSQKNDSHIMVQKTVSDVPRRRRLPHFTVVVEPTHGSSEINTKNRTSNQKTLSKAVLRQDGYYVASGNFIGSETSHFVLFFTSKGFVALGELEEFDNSDLTKEQYRQIIAEGEALNEIEVSTELTKFSKRGENITMKFYDPKNYSNKKSSYNEPKIYNMWSGKIIPNGLLLDLEVSRFSYALKDYEKQYPIQNLKFDFVPVVIN